MKTQTHKPWHLAQLITGIAVILLSSAGFARIVSWGPNSTDESGDSLAPDQMPAAQTTSEARVNANCAECGTFVSMRQVESKDTGPGAARGGTAGNQDESRLKATRGYQITVRMADGSSRVIEAANSATWRKGERLIVIAGAMPVPSVYPRSAWLMSWL